MRAYFARRAQAAAVVAGALSLAALAEVHGSDRMLYDRLAGRALALVVVAAVCGLAVVVLLAISRRAPIRAIAALGVAAVIWGWGVAQYPVLLPGTSVTLSNAGAPDDIMVAIIILFIIAVAVLGPSFAVLYILQGRRLLGSDEHERPLPGGVLDYSVSFAHVTCSAAGQMRMCRVPRRAKCACDLLASG